MSVWREVQEALYQRWRAEWGATSPYSFENEGFDPPAALWCNFRTIRMPGGPGTIGKPGNRKMDRVGLLLIVLKIPPGGGIGIISDRAEKAAAIFENKRLSPHDIRFAQVEPGVGSEIENGRWWGVSVEGRFDYEELK